MLYGTGFGADAIAVVDITDPRSLVLRATLRDSVRLHFANGVYSTWPWLFVACGGEVANFESRLTAVDITVDTAPTVMASVVDTSAMAGARKVVVVDVADMKVAVVVGQRGNQVAFVDVTDPLHMRVLGHVQDPAFLNLVHGAEPYRMTDGRLLVWTAAAGSTSAVGLIDATDPASPFTVSFLASDAEFQGVAGVRMLEAAADRRWAYYAVANNDGLSVVDWTDLENPFVSVHTYRDELRTSSPQHIEITADHQWLLMALQNQAPAAGGVFEGAVAVYSLEDPGHPRWVENVHSNNPIWRGCRHLQSYSATHCAVALRSGNGAAVFESPAAARRYLPSLREPADLPAGAANDWNAASIIAASGTPIASWPNTANPANPAVQANGALRPVFRTLQAGGRPAVAFDGTGRRLTTSDLSLAAHPRPRSYVVIASFATVALGLAPRLFASGVVNAAIAFALFGRNPNGKFNEVRLATKTASVIASAALPLGVPLVIIVTLAGTTARVVVGGFIEVSGTVSASDPQGLTIGAGPDGTSSLHGLIFRLADYHRTFTTSEINEAGRHARVRHGSPWIDLG